MQLLLCFCTMLCAPMFQQSETGKPTKATVATTNAATRIDNYLTKGVEQGFSGAVLIAKDGKIVLNKGFGLANKEQSLPISPDTVFSTGSVTKQFTATAILKLSEQKKLSVSDPLSRFFPNLPDDKKQITLHQLLTHSAGFVGSIGDGDFDHVPRDQFFKRLFKTRLRSEPGKKHNYSNAGYSILGRVVELASGQDYETYLYEQLFKPAGMEQTGYLRPKWNEAELAHGYRVNFMPMGTLIERFKNDGKISWNLKGNGGIHSTNQDMYKWYKALKNNTILSPAQTKTLTTPYIAEQESGDSHYAYGWAIFKSRRDTKIVSHNGGNGVFFHDFLWLTEENTVIILSTNAASRETEVAWKIEKMLFDETYQPEPIKKNVYQLVLDFASKNPPAESAKLKTALEKGYSSQLASPVTLNRIGYVILKSNQNLEWAVEVFKLNTEFFEKDGNSWDSLGDGYLAIGNTDEAIKSLKKAVELKAEGSNRKLQRLLKSDK
ncbi:MAG: serine hydrolase [Mariniblastus sp.]